MPPDLSSVLSQLRRHLHRNPEVGFEEHDTSAYVRSWLEEHGFEPAGPLAGTGFYVDIEGRRGGRRCGYRADMDALPVEDAKDVPYASTRPGVAHLCGHDAHMAIACGVLLTLQSRIDELAGGVRVFFQPNEERPPSGAPRMIADGVLGGLEAVFAVHVDPSLSVGRFGVRAGAITAACSPFVVRITTGTGGHSARPHETVDTVWLATQIVTQLYQLAGRVTDARKPSVITVCRFRAGDALNVIPGEVEFGGVLRGADAETFAFLRDKMRRVAGSAGALYGADVDVEFVDSVPAVVNTLDEVELVRRSVTAVFGPDAARDLPMPSMGGEDFAFYLEKLPGAMVRVGSASGSDTRYPLHHQRFDIDEAAMPMAARAMAETLIRFNAGPPAYHDDAAGGTARVRDRLRPAQSDL